MNAEEQEIMRLRAQADKMRSTLEHYVAEANCSRGMVARQKRQIDEALWLLSQAGCKYGDRLNCEMWEQRKQKLIKEIDFE